MKMAQIKTPTNLMRRRLFSVVFALIIFAAVYIGLKLFETSVTKSEYYRSKASTQQLRSLDIKASRGTIYDVNGNILAQSSTVWTVVINPNHIEEYDAENRELICRRLSQILDVDYNTLLEKSRNTENEYYIVKNKVDKAEHDIIAEFIEEAELSTFSISQIESSKRIYPNDELAATIIGFTNYDGQGVYGVEAYYDEYLTGTDGLVVTAKSADGGAMPYDYETRYDATDGDSVYLTIDDVVQHYLEKNLETTVSENAVANRATGIIMNVNTGAIIAMATSPGYNLNSPSELNDFAAAELEEYKLDLYEEYGVLSPDGEITTEDGAVAAASNTDTADEPAEGENGADDDSEPEKTKKELIEELLTQKEAELREEQWRNKAISDLYFPGSVFKVITCASALEEEVININSEFFCAGNVEIYGTKIECWNPGGHGVRNLTEAITASCNPAFIDIGTKLGAKLFSKYFEAFGFTTKTGIDLPAEVNSIYCSYDNMGPVELASSSFGQTNKITVLQMACAYAAAVNGGYLVQPHVLEKIVDCNGNVVKSAETIVQRQVISEETSKIMRQILEDVVEYNQGSNAYIAGYKIGGKSGTSEKLDEYSYPAMRYVSSFCAFTPADDPEYIMIVAVDEPLGGKYYGSAVAAPVVSAVFSECLERLGVYAQYTAEELAQQDTTVPNVYGMTQIQATTKINTEGLEIKYIGDESGIVQYTIPVVGSAIPRNGTVYVYMDDSETLMTTVPDVIGMSVAQANKAMAEAGLNISLSGGAVENDNAKASSQSIFADQEVAEGTVVEVEFIVNDETG